MKILASTMLCLTFFLLLAPILVQAETVEIKNPLIAKNITGLIGDITNIIKNLSLSVGAVMIIIGGLTIMTAGGSEEKVTRGKKIIFWTIVGVAIIVSINFITGLIFELLGYDIGR